VTTKIKDIWKADKRLRTLHSAVKQYCALQSKDFNQIAILIAEYRAMINLFKRIGRYKIRYHFSSKTQFVHLIPQIRFIQ